MVWQIGIALVLGNAFPFPFTERYHSQRRSRGRTDITISTANTTYTFSQEQPLYVGALAMEK